MKNLPLWIIAGVLSFIALMLVISILGFICYHIVANEQRRQEQIRREPWRQFE